MARNLAAQIPLDPEPDMYGKAAARRLPGRLHNRRAGIQPSRVCQFWQDSLFVSAIVFYYVFRAINDQ